MPAKQAPQAPLIVDLVISADEYLKHYKGAVTQVSAFSRDGRRVRFPTAILQPFVTREGIRGTFAIHFDATHKFVNIEKVG
ncbi:DUF2835 domain-containing protein [Reinekea sp.]|jgi:hypothetical protein|uniref:DUF2835 domain-containing protein n=1 Tax=Reinekea sp. TaxID=1970455 RepID=UPI002A80024F|nr:DUF2835 domain-containing protein [Reinekea sp.]